MEDGPMTMKKLSEVFPPDQIIRCDCGSTSFFDWGVQIGETRDYPSPRAKEWSQYHNVKICTACLKPVVFHDGIAYDASEYVSPQRIEELIHRGQAKEHLTPVKAMDP
jgi:hypothetical protein